MVTAGTYTAVLDRFEGDLAVLLLEADDEVVGHLDVDREALPENGRHQDAIFTVRVCTDELYEVQYEPELTDERRGAAQSQFDRLSRRLGDENDEE